MIFDREITDKFNLYLKQFKVVSLTGPRQSGKTTFLQNLLPDYQYVNLESPDIRALVMNDTRRFLELYPNKTIIDEAQEVPELFSYIQVKVDESDETGQYILSGSQNFLLMEKITQSLAGRVGVLRLFPLTISELQNNNVFLGNINQQLQRGGYPILNKNNGVDTSFFYDNYIETYVERDVRQLRNIENLNTFRQFIKLCAGRIGQELNLHSLGIELGLSQPTMRKWLSILETSYLVFQLQPYHKNFNKRITKSPKLYFYDTGLACNLLNINTPEQLETFYMRGALFENMVVSEYQKRISHQRFRANLHFWRENNGVEIDLLIEENLETRAVEIKSGMTITSDFTKNFRLFQKYGKDEIKKYQVIYGGDLNAKANGIDYLSWKRF